MRQSLTVGPAWLVLVARAAALAPAVGLELAPAAGHEMTPAADIEMGPSADIELGPAEDLEEGEELDQGEELPWETPHHSHSVLKRVISADAAASLEKADMLEAQVAPGAAEPVFEEEPTQSPEPPKRMPAGLVGFCASAPIYDGPTMGWEDCRTQCTGHCRFWSYWPDSVQHRCKLTVDCHRRERGGRHSVSTYRRALNAAGEEEEDDQADWGDETPPLDPEPQMVGAPEQEMGAPEVSATTCSPLGSARKFAVSPQSGWHNLGKARSYVSCANTSLSAGYRNLVWNVGSRGKGRCYGFVSDMPEVLERSCEDKYCWLFGPACQDQNLQMKIAQAEGSDSLEAGSAQGDRMGAHTPADAKFEEEFTGMVDRQDGEIAQHEFGDSIDAEHNVSGDANNEVNEFEGARSPAPEKKKKKGHLKEMAKGATRRIKHFFEGATRRFRSVRAGAAHKAKVNDSVEAERQATQEDNQTGVAADSEVNISVGKVETAETEVDDPVEGEFVAVMGSKKGTVAEAEVAELELLKGSKSVENGEARVNDTFDGEPHARINRNAVETAEADDNGS